MRIVVIKHRLQPTPNTIKKTTLAWIAVGTTPIKPSKVDQKVLDLLFIRTVKNTLGITGGYPFHANTRIFDDVVGQHVGRDTISYTPPYFLSAAMLLTASALLVIIVTRAATAAND